MHQKAVSCISIMLQFLLFSWTTLSCYLQCFVMASTLKNTLLKNIRCLAITRPHFTCKIVSNTLGWHEVEHSMGWKEININSRQKKQIKIVIPIPLYYQTLIHISKLSLSFFLFLLFTNRFEFFLFYRILRGQGFLSRIMLCMNGLKEQPKPNPDIDETMEYGLSLGIKLQSLIPYELLYVFLAQRCLFKVEVERRITDWFIVYLMETDHEWMIQCILNCMHMKSTQESNEQTRSKKKVEFF